MVLNPSILRSALVAVALSTTTSAALGCAVDCNFESVRTATKSVVSSSTLTRSPVDVNQQVVDVAARFSTVPGEDGALIYPVGTVADSAEVSSGVLTLYITFPAGVQKNSLDPYLTHHGSHFLKYYFAEDLKLSGTQVMARTAGDGEYVPVDEFVHYEEPPSEQVTLFAPNGPGPQPDIDLEPMYEQLRQQSPIAPRDIPGQGGSSTSGMPQGSLAGRIIYTYGGHGRTWSGTSWGWQRSYYNGMLEDFGNADASDEYAYYCFNAGATVVSFRPIGYQTNEVVIDNNSPAVTRTGTWASTAETRYYGSGPVPSHFALSSVTETATATYTPNIPEAGYYPVYTWVNYGDDRIPGGQLYRIRSTGGESQIRVDHRRVGCGWIYLGTYYFNAGSNPATGSVVISNQNPPGITSTSYVAIADTIRFGNGMGDVSNGGGISGLPRRDESTVYWIQNGWGVGNTPGTWTAAQTWNNSNTANDLNLSWSAPPYMAAQMTRLHSGDTNRQFALYLGWHSNGNDSTAARGSEGLITGQPTANQAWWAKKVSDELDEASFQEDDNWEYQFAARGSTYTGSYGEITNSYLQSKMDATIIEVAFHTSPADAALMRDPKVRRVHGRAAYHAAVAYFNQFQGGPLVYSPERPQQFRVKNNGDGSVALNWAPGLTGGTRGHAPTGYRVYQSPDGLGWSAVASPVGTAATISGLTPGQIVYFRIAAINSGGESFPTETLAVRVTNTGAPDVLVVNGFDRLDRFNNVPTPAGFSAAPEQLVPQRNNTYNYIRQHGEALAAAGYDFDSTSNEAVISGAVNLTAYKTVVWMLGEESRADKTFDTTEQARVNAFLAGGGNLFLSGSEVGFELDSLGMGQSFFRQNLKAQYVADSALTYRAQGIAGSIFEGLSLSFEPGANMYNVDSPDVIQPVNGSISALEYGAPKAIVESFDIKGNWQNPSYSGTTTANTSTFGIATSPRVEGTGSGQIGYNWTNGTILRIYVTAAPAFANNVTLSYWVYGDNSGHNFRIFIRDTVDNELFQSPPTVVNWTGWREFTWDLATAPLLKFAGNGDGALSGNVRLDSLYMTKVGASNTGNIYVDDVWHAVSTTGPRSAAVQFSGDYKLVHLAFPFEAINDQSLRNTMMSNVMEFFYPPSNVVDWSMY